MESQVVFQFLYYRAFSSFKMAGRELITESLQGPHGQFISWEVVPYSSQIAGKKCCRVWELSRKESRES